MWQANLTLSEGWIRYKALLFRGLIRCNQPQYQLHKIWSCHPILKVFMKSLTTRISFWCPKILLQPIHPRRGLSISPIATRSHSTLVPPLLSLNWIHRLPISRASRTWRYPKIPQHRSINQCCLQTFSFPSQASRISQLKIRSLYHRITIVFWTNKICFNQRWASEADLIIGQRKMPNY